MPKWFIRVIFIFLVFIIFFLFHMKVNAKLIGRLEEILKPRSISVKNGKAYITEREAMHIVSLQNGKLNKSFGKKGEGPGEFKTAPILRIFDKYFTANSWGKLLLYDLDGNYLKEIKHQFGHHQSVIYMKNGFFASKSNYSEKAKAHFQEFGIYDKELKLLKTIFEGPNPGEVTIRRGESKKPYPMVSDNISMDVFNGKIFISDTRKGFFFNVFDEKGTLLYQIDGKLKPVKVDQEFIKKEMKFLESQTWWAQLKNSLVPVFPEYFPEINFYTIRDNKIYVETHLAEGEKTLFRIYDLITKKISEVQLPTASENRLKKYDIRNGKYYYLLENEDDDNWELHVEYIGR